MKRILNAKVIAVNDTNIYFDNGITISFHQYETYVDMYDVKSLTRGDVEYYSPKHVKEGAE